MATDIETMTSLVMISRRTALVDRLLHTTVEPTWWSSLTEAQKSASISSQDGFKLDEKIAWKYAIGGPVDEHWRRCVEPTVTHCLTKDRKEIFRERPCRSWEAVCLMVGVDARASACPAVVFTDRDLGVRDRFRRVLQGYDQFRQSGFQIYCWPGGLRRRASSEYPRINDIMQSDSEAAAEICKHKKADNPHIQGYRGPAITFVSQTPLRTQPSQPDPALKRRIRKSDQSSYPEDYMWPVPTSSNNLWPDDVDMDRDEHAEISRRWQSTNVLGEKWFMPPSVLGRSFINSISYGDSQIQKKGIIAGVIRINGQDYGLAAAHCFTDHSKLEAITDPEMTMEDIDSIANIKMHPQIRCEGADHMQYFSEGVYFDRYSEIMYDEQAFRSDSSVFNDHRFYSLDYDWILLRPFQSECFHNFFHERDMPRNLVATNTPPCGQVIVASSTDEQYARLNSSGEVSLIPALGSGAPVEVYTLTSDMSMPRSGSLVFDNTGLVFGLVVADSASLGLTYVMPICTIFEEITANMGGNTPRFLKCLSPVDNRLHRHLDSYLFLRLQIESLRTMEDPNLPTTLALRQRENWLDDLTTYFQRAVDIEWRAASKRDKGAWLSSVRGVLRMKCLRNVLNSGWSLQAIKADLQDWIKSWEPSNSRIVPISLPFGLHPSPTALSMSGAHDATST